MPLVTISTNCFILTHVIVAKLYHLHAPMSEKIKAGLQCHIGNMYRLTLYLSVVKVYDKSLCEYGSPNSAAPAQCQFLWLAFVARYSHSMYRLNEEITPGPSAQIFSLRELCDFMPV